MERINWNKIKTSNGTAVNIPQAFELLKSNSLEDRKKGYWLIDNHVVLQSDLYEAAYYVIDPLMELLDNSELEKKYLIIELLIEIAYGYAPPSLFINIGEEKVPLQQACSSKLKLKEKEIEQLIFEVQNKELNDKLKELLNAINDE